MNKKELRKLAKQHGVGARSLETSDLIRNIQSAEGNFSCYATATRGECDQAECRWRADCLSDSTGCRPRAPSHPHVAEATAR